MLGSALLIVAAVLLLALPSALRRLDLSFAKHRSLAGHSEWSRRLAAWVPFYEYDETSFFGADGAPLDIIRRRREGFAALAVWFQTLCPKSSAFAEGLEAGLSDLQFTTRYRVPFQFSTYVRRHLRNGAIYQLSDGVTLRDLDGNSFIDLSGSYGVNTFGYDFYKECIGRGSELASHLGPVLGAHHPVVSYNVQRLKEISGLDEVSFHMSGTEAVMQAVRLARYHTGRQFLVRFCGAYHGWWGEVQPGVGNPTAARDTYTLAEMSKLTLRVLSRRNDIACVLVNPLQAMHPNCAAPSDSTLIDSSRSAAFDHHAYTRWLGELRQVCSLKGIALIFDEVFVGFRLANGGAQEYFGISADMVTYGKTVGGGLPVGVLCGGAAWMRRFRAERPADICFARGTFNTHPYVMGTMHEFLRRLNTPEIQGLYVQLDDTWNRRARAMNLRFDVAGLPIRFVHLSTIWVMTYLNPSRYNWMLQFYLRAQGIALSWVGTARIIFSLNFSEADFNTVADRIVAAAMAMQADGWWSSPEALTNRAIRQQVLREMLQAKRFRFIGSTMFSRIK
jgi:glutamate-1-semialdehyde 2,1-aminomutase